MIYCMAELDDIDSHEGMIANKIKYRRHAVRTASMQSVVLSGADVLRLCEPGVMHVYCVHLYGTSSIVPARNNLFIRYSYRPSCRLSYHAICLLPDHAHTACTSRVHSVCTATPPMSRFDPCRLQSLPQTVVWLVCRARSGSGSDDGRWECWPQKPGRALD